MVSEELKACPFCGKLPTVGGGQVVKANCECFDDEKCENYFPWDVWQNRSESILQPNIRRLPENFERISRNFAEDEIKRIDAGVYIGNITLIELGRRYNAAVRTIVELFAEIEAYESWRTDLQKDIQSQKQCEQEWWEAQENV